MVRRGRVKRGLTVGLSWASGEAKLAPPGGTDAAEAEERLVSTAGRVYV